MSSNDVRKGMTNAQFNEKQSGILMTEIFIIAVVCGLYFTSWWVFGGVLLGLLIGLFIPQVAIPFIILLSVGWGGCWIWYWFNVWFYWCFYCIGSYWFISWCRLSSWSIAMGERCW